MHETLRSCTEAQLNMLITINYKCLVDMVPDQVNLSIQY